MSKRQKRLNINEISEPITRFKNNLENIEVTVDHMPSWEDLRGMLPRYINATWSQDPMHFDYDDMRKRLARWYGKEVNYSDEQIADMLIYRLLRMKFLPTLLESVRINTTFKGISSHDVTHLLRYRRMAFFADCTGDKLLHERDVVVPESIQTSPELYERYMKMVHETKAMYAEMLASGNFTIQDARMVLPRTLETFYHVSMTLSDALNFINHRVDQQIQPQADNVMAYQLAIGICEQYPLLATVLDLNQKNKFFIHETQSNFKSGFTRPLPQNNVFDWDENDLNSSKYREELAGNVKERNAVFPKLKKRYEAIMENTRRKAKSLYPHVFETLDYFE